MGKRKEPPHTTKLAALGRGGKKEGEKRVLRQGYNPARKRPVGYIGGCWRGVQRAGSMVYYRQREGESGVSRNVSIGKERRAADSAGVVFEEIEKPWDARVYIGVASEKRAERRPSTVEEEVGNLLQLLGDLGGGNLGGSRVGLLVRSLVEGDEQEEVGGCARESSGDVRRGDKHERAGKGMKRTEKSAAKDGGTLGTGARSHRRERGVVGRREVRVGCLFFAARQQRH